MCSISKHAKYFEQYLVYLVVKTTKHTNFVYICVLYYEILWTSYTNLALDKIVTLFFFLDAFVSKTNFFFIISKIVFNLEHCYNAIVKRERLNCCIKMRVCQSCLSQDIKYLVICKFFCYIEYKQFNRKCNLTSLDKKIDKALNIIEKLNNKILNIEAKTICLCKQRKH